MSEAPSDAPVSSIYGFLLPETQILHPFTTCVASECVCVQFPRRNIDYVFQLPVLSLLVPSVLPLLLRFSALPVALERTISWVVMFERHFKPERPEHPKPATSCLYDLEDDI